MTGSPRPIAVAITGGIGAGKSAALDAFRVHGAAVVSSDAIVHHLLATDDGVRDALVAKLGPEILGEDGRPDRARIAREVFGDPERLAWLEQLVHPLVSQEYLEWREQLARLDEPPRVCVTEVPLLFEVGAQERFDRVVVITAPRRAPRAAAAGRPRRPRRPAPARPGEGAPGRLPLRQHRDVRGAERVGRRRHARARGGGGRRGVKRLALVALLALVVVAGAAAWVVTAEPEWYQRARYPLRYEAIVRTHARNYDLPPTLLAAVIYAESKFDPSARSGAGAVGLMQLLPDTARGIATRTGGDGFVVSDLLDPEINVRYGSWYLRNLLNRYDDDLRTALAAYHAGPGNVDALAARGRRDPVSRDAGLRRPRPRRARGLRRRLRGGARAALTRADRVGGEPPQQLGVGRGEPEARWTTIPSKITPRNWPISRTETSERRRFAAWPSSIHARLRSRAGSGAIVSQRLRRSASARSRRPNSR